jgi:NADH-quinone oxidoreductase subunit F
VDLHLLPDSPTEEERAAVDELLGPPESGWVGGPRDATTETRVVRAGRASRDRRDVLLPALHALNDRIGWISRGGLNYVCQRLTVPPAEAYGVATFYALFRVEPRAPTVVHVCDDIACRVNGAKELCRRLEETAGPEGSATGNGSGPPEVEWHRSPCLGMCDRAPAAFVQRAARPDVSIGVRVDASLRELGHFPEGGSAEETITAPQALDPAGGDGLRLLRRVGRVDPSSVDDYRAAGGYEALRRAIELGPEGTIREVSEARLLGRGGAAFPTGAKWDAVSKQPQRPHYFVCNADESEPGTFKDRVLMELDPFAVIESLTVAGFATGSERGFIYIRGEYPRAAERLQHAIGEARRLGLLGKNVLGREIEFDVELRRGAGAYICGEETALFNSLEGKRGEPRNKLPFPVQRGLFGKPTGINNVETLVNVLEVMRIGGSEYTKLGTDGSTGTRLFCVSGTVNRPGLYELEHGATVGEVLDLAGGSRRRLKAVLLGGAAGGFVGPDDLDLRLTFEDAREGGYTLGSGVVMAFDDSVDLVDIVLRIAAFFRDESCGQCVPCRVGTVRQEEALFRLVTERTIGSRTDEISLLSEIAQVMRDASICGLGQTAASAVQSAVSRLGLFDGGMSA